MTRFSLWLVAITASLGLAASQSQQEKQGSKHSPVEIQIGGSLMGYATHEGRSLTGPDYISADFAPKNNGLAPSIRISLDHFIVPKVGSLVFSAGYRLGNDIPLEIKLASGTRNAYSDLRHSSQLQVGALLRFDYFEKFDFGVGVDARNDWMKSKGRDHGTDSQNSIWRPWLRLNARYLCDKGRYWTPFIGVEAAFALDERDIHPRNYYRDYAINTGDFALGNFDTSISSPDASGSFTRAHAPKWEAAIVVGIRFGRHCPK